MKTTNTVSIREFNQEYYYLTAEALIEKYNQLFRGGGVPKQAKVKPKQAKQPPKKPDEPIEQAVHSEDEHLERRHERHERDRFASTRLMESYESDMDFIEGLRATQIPVTAQDKCEIWN